MSFIRLCEEKVPTSVNLDLAIETLIALDQPFALYRLPGEQEPNLLLQSDNTLTCYKTHEQLASVSGFLMAPFSISDAAPMVVLKADKRLHGFKHIESYLEQAMLSPAFSAYYQKISAKNCAEDIVFAASCDEQWEEQQSKYKADFAAFHEALMSHQFDKLVLSTKRALQYRPFRAYASFVKACMLYPKMMVSLVSSKLTGTWLGATPEILIKGQGENFQTMSLAGTMLSSELDCSHPEDLSLWSDKDKLEQEFVTHYIREVISPYAASIDEHGPYFVQAGPVCHLRTDFHFKIKDELALGQLIGKLHPTPAVCGLPKQEAYDFIIKTETINRRYYSGMLGPLNLDESSQLFVNLRCMEVHFEPDAITQSQAIADVYAGGGNLRQSQCPLELQEACNKMKAICSAIVDPRKGE